MITYEEFGRQVRDGIVTPAGHCPVTPLLLMLQGKWKAQILYAILRHGNVRFGSLKREIEGITNTMLTRSLRELERDGLVARTQFNEMPPHVEYAFTPLGRDLEPIFYAIMVWGFKHERDLFPDAV